MESHVRKISVGPDFKQNAMHYVLGQKVLGDNHIHAILLEGSNWNIYVVNEKKEVLLWKTFNEYMPLCVEYNIDF
jgi:hypothetical protein